MINRTHKSPHMVLFLLAISLFFQQTFAAVQLRVFFKQEETSTEKTLTRPRFYIQNFGTEPLTNFYCYYYFTTELNKTPVVEDYYTPDASISLENLSNGNYRVKFNFSGITIYPGQTLPNPDGEVIGIHYTDWSVLDKTNDLSYTGLSTFTLNGNIPVYSSNGTLIYGNTPSTPENPPQPPAVLSSTSQYAVLSSIYTDLRDRVIVKGGSVGSSEYVEAGCNVVVNGNINSKRNIFLREKVKVNGSVTAGELLNKQNNDTITGTQRSHAQIEMPSITRIPVSVGTIDDITVPNFGMREVEPGSYRDLVAYSNSIVILKPGNYSFNKFSIDTDSKIILRIENADRLSLNVKTELRLSDRTVMSFEKGIAYPHSVKMYSAQTGSVFIGNKCQIYGDLSAPDAEIHVYSGTNYFGSICGMKVVVEPESVICNAPILQDLWHAEWNMSPSFDPLVMDYKTVVTDATTTLKVTPLFQTGTLVTINGASPENPVVLSGGTTNLNIALSNADQCGTTAYNLKVTRNPQFQIFVNDDSPCNAGAEDGTSWATAYKDLQKALNKAALDGKEIWLAEGIYKPTSRTNQNDPRSATFLINPGIEIRGGFKGNEIDTITKGSVYNTILSGDIYGNDNTMSTWPPAGSDQTAIADNVYHVVTIDGISRLSTTRLTGCVVEHGNANSGGNDALGGGIYLKNSAPILEQVIIRNNISNSHGAGIFVNSNLKLLKNCLLKNNFTMNGYGAGVFIQSCDSTSIDGSIFDNNLQCDSSLNYGGGALFANCKYISIINSIFTRNHAEKSGGAIVNENGNIEIINCTFANNSAVKGGQSIYNTYGVVTVTNTILWNNYNKTELDSIGFTVTYSTVTKGFTGEGNNAENPLFVDINKPEGADGRFYSLDDGLMLSSASKCIGKGVTNTKTPLIDIILTERSNADIGAYEYFVNQSSDKVFGYLKNDGTFVSEGVINIIDKICHWWYVSIYAKCNYAVVAQVLVKKDKYTKDKQQIYSLFYSLDENGNQISWLEPVTIQLYKTGERDGSIIFQTQTQTQGKPIIFVEDASYHNWYNNWAYVVCARSSNFKSVTPSSQF